MCGINIPADLREPIHNTGVTEEQRREMIPHKYVLFGDVLLIGRYIQGQIIRKHYFLEFRKHLHNNRKITLKRVSALC